MATSVYFNNFQGSQEQQLIEDLVIESIKMYGHDLYYIPRTRVAYDTLYAEDASSTFRDASMVEMYIKSIDGFDGDGDFISKFGLEIRDRVTFTVARRTFNYEVGSAYDLIRPREGDLIFFPLNGKMFEIKFVEHESIFYQLGALQSFDLICELFEYSNETFSTGIQTIDTLFQNNYISGKDYTSIASFAISTELASPIEFLTTEDGLRLYDEQFNTVADADTIQVESDAFIDFTEIDPFAEGGY